MPHRRSFAVFGVAAALMLSGCAGQAQPAGGTGEITVFAAASLTEAFTEIETVFERADPEVDVQFNFAGSSTLAQQINRGAPVDVFASASPKQMQTVADAADPTVFARNTLQIVVPRGNPAGITGLPDLGKQELTIALCAEQVPCGDAALTALRAGGVTPASDTLEQDVKAVLTKVMLGEADAGLVYRTDVLSADGVEGARAFVDHVLSAEGKAVLERYGFGT